MYFMQHTPWVNLILVQLRNTTPNNCNANTSP
ncbi:unnamed protein product [Larinioides sclopetarius]|uniref:Uncharacterized protein n=1 Tax=Larinioides sclopetarius TaxID=280406 RepID=A0AAV1YU56_9ARAC